ncbi:MAG TPA: cell wall-binding repeat-containing protein [Acidimicrobiales bacterium]|nr:cell wall-binding repeat-containing protein [Acidimicrobiales bacterium]
MLAFRVTGVRLAIAVVAAALVLGTIPASAGAPYSITLTASATTLARGSNVTLVATANQEITSPYGIVIVDGTGANVVSCFGAWTACDTVVGWNEDKTVTYTAKIVNNTNTSVLATSSSVTVVWGAGSSSGGDDAVAPTDRIAGTNRYETATEIAQFWDSTTASVVYVATGANFPDALGGGPAAANEGAPILLVEQNAIPATTAAELSRLRPTRIVLLGGTAAISDVVHMQLGSYATTVDRVAGLNRYATAAAVVAYAFSGTEPTVYVASGRAFPDPIIAGAAAAIDGAPLLLVDGLAPLENEVGTQLVRLGATEIVVVGPDSALSGVLTSLAGYAPLTRVNAADIYARSAALWDGVAAPVAEVVLATSNSFADALAGTPYAAMDPVSYLMLSQTACVPSVVRAQMERLSPSSVRLLGGTAALSTAIETQTTC